MCSVLTVSDVQVHDENSYDSFEESDLSAEVSFRSLQPRKYGTRVARRKAIFESLSSDVSSTASTSSENSPRLSRRRLNASCRNFLAFQTKDKAPKKTKCSIPPPKSRTFADLKVYRLLDMLEDKSAALEKERGDGRLDMEDIVAAADKIIKETTCNDEKNTGASDVWKNEKGEGSLKTDNLIGDITAQQNIVENQKEKFAHDDNASNVCKDVTNTQKMITNESAKVTITVNTDNIVDKMKPIHIGIPVGYQRPAPKHWTSFKVCGKNVRKMTYSQYREMLDSYARRRKEEAESETKRGSKEAKEEN